MLKRNHINRNGFRVLFISLLMLNLSAFHANELHPLNTSNNLNQPSISIIIDDMGYRLKLGERAVKLLGNFTYSFLPHAPYAVALSENAHSKNKEIMLHIPMEAEGGARLGPGGLTQCMTKQKFTETLESNIKSVPHATGFNNHMGSLLTKSQLLMTQLMKQVALDKKLFFVDSQTTSNSVALKVAKAEGLNSIRRDIFIDHEESEEFIQKQLRKLIRRAKNKGTALAIAHPKKLTLSLLEKWLPKLEEQGIKLIFVSELIELKKQQRLALWEKK